MDSKIKLSSSSRLKSHLSEIADDYISQGEAKDLDTIRMPIVHLTESGRAISILETDRFETRKCSVFSKDLVYFFLARSAYKLKGGYERSTNVSVFPFVFIIPNTEQLQPYHIYPFDSGGAHAGVFDSADPDPYVPLQDYALRPTYRAVSAHIQWAFGSTENYMEGRLRKGIEEGIPYHDGSARSYIRIARSEKSGTNRPDSRVCTIEIAYGHNIDVNGNVKFAIFPDAYLDNPVHSAVKIISEMNIDFQTYHWIDNSEPNSHLMEVSNIVENWMRKNGYIKK